MRFRAQSPLAPAPAAALSTTLSTSALAFAALAFATFAASLAPTTLATPTAGRSCGCGKKLWYLLFGARKQLDKCSRVPETDPRESELGSVQWG